MPMSARITNFAGGIVAEKRGGARQAFRHDPLGSTIAVISDAGTTTVTYTYWPYGEVRSSTGSATTPWKFCGRWGYYEGKDTTTYVRARVLKRDLARWLTVDPLWPEEKAYEYADNSPLTILDVSGLKPGGCTGENYRACVRSCLDRGGVKSCRQRSKRPGDIISCECHEKPKPKQKPKRKPMQPTIDAGMERQIAKGLGHFDTTQDLIKCYLAIKISEKNPTKENQFNACVECANIATEQIPGAIFPGAVGKVIGAVIEIAAGEAIAPHISRGLCMCFIYHVGCGDIPGADIYRGMPTVKPWEACPPMHVKPGPTSGSGRVG